MSVHLAQLWTKITDIGTTNQAQTRFNLALVSACWASHRYRDGCGVSVYAGERGEGGRDTFAFALKARQ